MERNWASLWLLVFLVPALSGCLGDESPLDTLSALRVDAAGLESGEAYLFEHGGGTLTFQVLSGEAVFTLFDPQDHRLGQLELGTDHFRESLGLEAMGAGEYVLVTEVMNGTFQVLSGGEPVTGFERLGQHFERVVLAEVPLQTDPTLGLLSQIGVYMAGSPIDETVNFTLGRTPTRMQLLAGGQASEIKVTVQGSSGTVLTFEDFGYNNNGVTGSSLYIAPVGGSFEARNVRGADYHAHIVAQEFSGVLILESWSYSRYIDPVEAPATTSTDAIDFTYGELPGRPATFMVHDRAEALYFWTRVDNTTLEDCEDSDCEEALEAWVSLYDPADHKLGTYRIPADQTLRVPVSGGGEYVAVAKRGVVLVGADRVPADFEIRVLDILQTTGPETPAGNSTQYAIRQGSLTVEGVAYSVRREMIVDDTEGPVPMPYLGLECSDEGTIRIIQDGETLGFWGESLPAAWGRAELFIRPGPIEFIQDGAGGTCGYEGMVVSSYLR